MIGESMTDKELREQVISIMSPHETRDTMMAGGIIDWETKWTKAGLDFHVDKIIDLIHQHTNAAVEEFAEKIKKGFYGKSITMGGEEMRFIIDQIMKERNEG